MLIELILYVFALFLFLSGSALVLHAATSLAREFRGPLKTRFLLIAPKDPSKPRDNSNRAA